MSRIKVYHVTTNAPAVRVQGLRTGVGVGLGGVPYISTTSEYAYAQRIKETITLAVRAAKNEVSVEQILAWGEAQGIIMDRAALGNLAEVNKFDLVLYIDEQLEVPVNIAGNEWEFATLDVDNIEILSYNVDPALAKEYWDPEWEYTFDPEILNLSAEPVSPVVELTPPPEVIVTDAADIAGVGRATVEELMPRGRGVLSALEQIQAETGMTREQIRRAVATSYGRFNPDTYGRYPSEADTRLANLYNVMRERGRYLTPPITTTEQAGELRRLIQANAPVESGALRDSFDDPRTVQIMPDGAVEIDNPLPYARIQDLGGTIHRVSPAGNSYTIRIPAQHYVGKAIAEYNARHAEENLRQGDTLGGLSIAELVTRGTALVQSLRRAG